jgi:amino acid adenylation domain-containing protein
VLEEAPSVPQPESEGDRTQLLVLSARSEAALQQARANLADHMGLHPEQRLADVAHTLQAGRRAFAHRAILLCHDSGEAAAALAAGRIRTSHSRRKDPPVVFMFPGQGTQYPEMGRGLYDQEPEFRRHFDTCAEIIEPLVHADLREVLYPRGDRCENGAAEGQILATLLAQPALFAVEYATARLWMDWGVHPAAMVGHSVGEFVAATLAGVMSLADALGVVAERARLMQSMPGGAMLAVRLPASELGALIASPLAIAAVNSPTLCVVAGPYEAVDELADRLGGGGVMARRLHTSHAFHSPMMDPIVQPLADHLRGVVLSAPQLPYVSTVTGGWADDARATSPECWARQAREPVQFAAAMASLPADRWPVLLEVGPGNALATLALQARRGSNGLVLGSLPDSARPLPDRDLMLDSLGQLWMEGLSPDWRRLHGASAARVPLPSYPFQRHRHWVEPPSRSDATPLPVRAVATPEAAPPVKESPAPASPAPAQHPMPAIGARITAILEDLSGESLADMPAAASFLEMGFDSLFLNQVAQRVQVEFQVKIAFRQLLGDYSTIPSLATYLALQLPSQKPASVSPPPGTGDAAAPPNPRFDDSPDGHDSHPPNPARPSRFDAYRGAKPASATELTPEQRRHIDGLAQRYNARTAGSKRLAEAYRSVLADPRSVAGFRPEWKELVYPIVCARSKGARIWDVDGNEYIDLVNGYGQTAFGHAPDFVIEAVMAQIAKGFAIGPQAELAGEVAQLFSELTGNERVTFCNTGSEAVMAALRVSRAVTGRDKVVVFNGAYHGQFDEVLVKGVNRPDGTPRTLAVAAGIPSSATENIVVLDYATPAALQWIEQNAQDLAAVVVEPVQSRHPDLQPFEFLHQLRSITEMSGTAFVMDEVVTGFRVHLGGMQALTGIRADLATYGKVLGGGLPIGILAGKAKFMDALDGGAWRYGDDSVPEVGVTFFAGTFVRHPLALAAALAVLKHLKVDGRLLHERTAARISTLAAQLAQLFQAHGLTTGVESYASFLYFDLFHEHPLARLLFHHLRLRGIHIQDGFPCFLTTAHSDADIEATVAAFADSLTEMSELGIFSRDRVGVAGSAASDGAPEKAASVPLSESQLEIWLAAQRGDDASCAFNESVTLRLEGRLDRSAFESAINRTIARHDALRASFGVAGEEMRIAPRLEVTIPLTDLSDEVEPTDALQLFIDEDARIPFDLSSGPLIRGRLLRLAPDSHAAIITAHHLVCDGWSINIILREIVAGYGAACSVPSEVLPQPYLFSDYVRLEQDRSGEAAVKTEAYWLAQFTEPPPHLELPLDRPRGAHKSYAGASRRRQIPAELYRAVKDSGAKRGCTLFVTLLAGFQFLMGRLAQSEDIVVGVPAAGQSLLENDHLVGQCVNFLPLRTRWKVDSTIADLLAATRESVLQAYEHQAYTLGTLVRKLAPERDSNRLPLTDLQFNLERLADRFQLPGMEIAVEPNPKAHVNSDIFFNIIESDAGLRVDCDYNTDLWDAATIDGWLDSYTAVLREIAADTRQRIGQVPYLAESERARLATLESMVSDFPRDTPLHALFEKRARMQPEAVALRCGEEALTYAALDRQANKLANHIRARGVASGGLIGVMVKRSPELLVALLAVLKSGSAYVPLDPAHPAARLEQILGDAEVSALLIDGTSADEFSLEGAPVVDLAAEADEISDMPDASPETIVEAGDLAYVIYTSGSTGIPKGVEVTHRSVVNLMTAMAREPGLAAGDSLLAVTTVSFDIAALELFLPLCVGATTIIARREDIADGFRLVERLETTHATVLQATPGTFRLLVEAGFRARAGFKMLCGGEALPPDLAKELLQGDGELWNMYGPTEATIWSSCKRITSSEQPITIGKPLPNTQFHILDRYGQHVPIGKAGELHIAGEGVARGYHRQPALTAERFVVNPLGDGRLYRTGDLTRCLPTGEVQILGRLDQQIKLRGFRIEPGEIEMALTRQLGLAAAVVALRQDAPSGPQLVAYYVEHPGRNESSAALRTRLGAVLPDYMVPVAWMRLDRLPLLPNGKLDRASLPRPEALATMSAGSGRRPTPQTATQMTLANIWAQVLGLERVGLHDDLLDLGADSIHIFRITARANKEGLRITAKQLIQFRTIEEIARQLGDGEYMHPVASVSQLRQLRPALAVHPVADRPMSTQ